ncbi:hypothetical protein [Legionella shakespearei]|uniref:Uncharacterized protein n=1 Tax=Legionella shakespearei DSM 23087 TaxID=1122169 RepID=A0A0W0YT30_9GAMM|nr:hypothetical protein [Legionella shakespearei]KTD60065.1 hypothetical protein Lsha_1815 [Legionella shakespearei DSM 23087]
MFTVPMLIMFDAIAVESGAAEVVSTKVQDIKDEISNKEIIRPVIFFIRFIKRIIFNISQFNALSNLP